MPDNISLLHPFRDILNPAEHYQACKDIDNTLGDGTFLLAGCRVNAFWKMDERQFFYEPISTYDSVLHALSDNIKLKEGGAPFYCSNFVSVAFRLFKSANDALQGRLPLPISSDKEQSHGHAVAVVGWDDCGESLYFRNSWGTSWGENGYGRLSREYFNRYVTDAYITRRVRWGIAINKIERLQTASTSRNFAAVWTDENPHWRYRVKYRGASRHIHIYDTWSYEYDCFVEVIEIRHRTGVRIAWAYLFHLSDLPKITLVKEFYVWSWFHRRGYGKWLEDLVCQQSRLRGSEYIQILFHDMDGQARVRSAGRHFAVSRGYKWKWRSDIRPCVVGIAEKNLKY